MTKTERNKAYYAANKEAGKARARAWREANPERNKASTCAWRAANKERHIAVQRAWLEANAEYRAAYRRANYAKDGERERAVAREWKRQNAHRVLAATAKRNAIKKRAMPSWANIKEIEKIYAQSRQMSALTGIQHHVDHIVPLQSRFVCGLHWEGNLRIITAHENQAKKNRLISVIQ